MFVTGQLEDNYLLQITRILKVKFFNNAIIRLWTCDYYSVCVKLFTIYNIHDRYSRNFV
jgi:hypothetical protein